MAGIAAFYSLIHVPRERAPVALAEMARVLRPEGRLAIAVHRSGEIQATEFLGQPHWFSATLFEPDELADLVADAGLAVEGVTAREPYPTKHATQRIYVLARSQSS